MTGGTALAAYYLQHRLSEDLDLFTDDESVAARMKRELEAAAGSRGFSAQFARSAPTFLEASVKCGDETVQIHMALDSPYRLESPVDRPDAPLRVESALDLAANKIAALYGRASAKDFVDLYFIHHEIITIEELVPEAARKSPGIEPYWLARAFRQVQQVEGLPKMLKPITLGQLKLFFLGQAERLMEGANDR
jgi:predicted nucleotidyltransferase component of viral defense system